MFHRRMLGYLKEQNWFAVIVEFLIVVLGVFLGIQASNWNEARAEQRLGEAYLDGFRADLLADSRMLTEEIEGRRAQSQDALAVLEFYDGRELEPALFFEAFYSALYSRQTQPNRNTMDEVLNAGALHLIEDDDVRLGLLDLQATYRNIEASEEHLSRDFDQYLYDPTFSSIPVQIAGPWQDTPALRRDAQALLDDTRIENGLRLVVANLQLPGGIEDELEVAKAQVDDLLRRIPEG
ncbi:hypothetical protein [Aurantiacibacter hainanensis]|uniref:hypothetical protein n=1 Tax=Aurantiacibacter hainanensis TaxID=3076114 RepID=UPI0030C76940